jgi:hypothetical protein
MHTTCLASGPTHPIPPPARALKPVADSDNQPLPPTSTGSLRSALSAHLFWDDVGNAGGEELDQPGGWEGLLHMHLHRDRLHRRLFVGKIRSTLWQAFCNKVDSRRALPGRIALSGGQRLGGSGLAELSLDHVQPGRACRDGVHHHGENGEGEGKEEEEAGRGERGGDWKRRRGECLHNAGCEWKNGQSSRDPGDM